VIGVFTGNRSEYGLQYPVLKAIDQHPGLDYRLIVSGAHLNENFGRSLEEIRNDGFHIDVEVQNEIDASSMAANVQSIGSGILNVGKALQDLNLDIMMISGDRFESPAAVVAAT